MKGIVLLLLSLFLVNVGIAQAKFSSICYSLKIDGQLFDVMLDCSKRDTLSFSGNYFGDSISSVHYTKSGKIIQLIDGRSLENQTCSFVFDTFVRFGDCYDNLQLAKPFFKRYKGFKATKYFHFSGYDEYIGSLIMSNGIPLEIDGFNQSNQQHLTLKVKSSKRR